MPGCVQQLFPAGRRNPVWRRVQDHRAVEEPAVIVGILTHPRFPARPMALFQAA